MKPHPRIRKTVKWGGLVVTLLLVGVWMTSMWWAIFWAGPHNEFRGVFSGAACYCNPRPWISAFPYRAGWHMRPTPRPAIWLPTWETQYGTALTLPLWLPTALIGAVTIPAWRLDTLARRRADRTRCFHCRYDRTGLAAGAVCPECGLSPPPAPPSSSV